MKPKLADGSRWEDKETVIECDDTRTYMVEDDDGRRWLESDCGGDSGPSLFHVDALAVIRAAGLDPVWGAAVEIFKHWDDLGYITKSSVACDDPFLADMLNALCAAVESASEKEQPNGD